jgi:hypothetical protein
LPAGGDLAHPGQIEDAREAVAGNLRIKPGLTISKLRMRPASMTDSLWDRFSEGLPLAGLPH